MRSNIPLHTKTDRHSNTKRESPIEYKIHFEYFMLFFFGRALVPNSTGKLKRVHFAICIHCSQSKMQNVLIFSMLFDGTGFLHFHRKIQHEIVKIRCAFFHTRESVNSSTPPGSYLLYADHFMFIVLPIDSSCLETTFQLNDRIGASFVV